MTQENDKKIDARYQSIAYQLAKRISGGELYEGLKLSGRTLLASEYEVSSETIRKAMAILQRFGVVDIHERSGIIVRSKAAADHFVEVYVNQKADRKLLSDTVAIKQDLGLIEGRLQEVLDRLIGATKTGFFPFDFFAFTLEEGDRHLNQDLRTTDLKNQTQALMIGYEYEGVFVQNPEASVILKPGMTLSLLGGPLEKDHVERFFKGEPHES